MEPPMPNLRAIPAGLRTRFAPAPTGDLHLGHLVNAALVWGIARATGGSVALRIEDHDRQRARPAWEAGILADLERLGLIPDVPPLAELRAGPSAWRQSDHPERYVAALAPLRAAGRVYGCDCTRTSVAAWGAAHGRPWSGPGCPGRCADRGLAETPDRTLRLALGAGTEAWDDLALGPQAGEPAAHGDLPVRDRAGNWTYAWCVVVDDLHDGIGCVIRGLDLAASTPVQLRVARFLAGAHPARFLHHPLVRHPDGTKLSKSDGATAVRALLAAGADRAGLLADALRAAGIPGVPRLVAPDALGAVVAAARAGAAEGAAPDVG
ncbi:MAG: glutamate--tRNA ligase family protein [Chloroflexota bacterium]